MGELHDRMPIILAENGWPKWITGVTQIMSGRGIENLAGRQDGRQRKKQPQLILPVLSNEVPA